ncbi:class I SAM-dependent methyltransferase [Bdellovibrionota bacterium FG-1]
MSEFKDLFSKKSGAYAKFRPKYPDLLFRYLASLVDEHELAWDVGTGNGQAAVKIADHFKRVVATDPSAKQISSAARRPNVEYRVGTAEKPVFKDRSLDLITVAQAFHWFRQDEFFAEAKRMLKPGGVLALWCYELIKISPEIDAVIHKLYKDILGPYWEKERALVEEGYRNVVFPFKEITAPQFEITAEWSFAHLIGYLGTWSALQAYVQAQKSNPLEAMYGELKTAWGDAPKRSVRWEIGMRVGRGNL